MRLTRTPRVELARELRDEISHNYPRGRIIIGVDGVNGSGAENVADDLADTFRENDVATFRASLDDFHRPREERYRQGEDAPEGYYTDSFNYALFRRVLIEPFRLAGSAGFQLVGFDEQRDVTEQARWVTAPRDAVLIVDGVFVHRAELRGLWHYSVWVDVPLDIAWQRLHTSIGVDANPEASSNARYRGGLRLYFADTAPSRLANAVVDNVDPEHPVRRFLDSC